MAASAELIGQPVGAAAPVARAAERPLTAAPAFAWLLLAVGALLLAALFAAFIAAARVPGLPGGEFLQRHFGAALVQHVTLAKLVWLLGAAAAAWTLVGGRSRALGWALFGAAALGTAGVVGAFLTDAPPVLNNYVPVLDHPLFLGGLALFCGAVLASAALAAFNGRRLLSSPAVLPPVRVALLLAVLPLLLTAFSLATSIAELPAGQPLAVAAERLFWEPGHTLQFVFTALLVAAWLHLLPLAARSRSAPRTLLPALWLTVLPVALTPVLHAAWTPDTEPSRRAFTLLMSFGTWPGPLWVALLLLADRRAGGRPLDVPALAALLSMALFVLGLLVGLLIRGETTTIPAHYHATVGATTLAALGVVLAVFDRARSGSLRRRAGPLLAYAGGFLLIVAGFALAGSQRVPRKAPGASVEGEPLAWLGLVAMGIGAAAAVAGVLWFGMRVAAALRAQRRAEQAAAGPRARADRRLPALAGTAVAVVLAGAFIAWLNAPPRAPQTELSTVIGLTPDQQTELRARFNQGVLMLHAKQHEHALTAFDRVLQIAPKLPEGHVNVGYALLALQRWQEAAAAFSRAIELRPHQINAYYGLAVALDASGDRAGAIGAMRSYAHLAPADDPFRRKADAALWEWEADSARRAGADSGARRDAANNAPAGAAAPTLRNLPR